MPGPSLPLTPPNDRNNRMNENPIIEHIDRIAQGQFSPENQAWLSAAFREYVEAGLPIDHALGLNHVHSRGARHAVNHRRMTRQLRAAADLTCGETHWTKASLLSAEIKAFARSKWPRWAGTGVPEARSDMEKTLFLVFRAAHGNPQQSPERIYSIICDDTQRRSPE